MTPTEITDLAAKRGIKIARLLKDAGINHSTCWRWRHGKFQPRASSVDRIKKALKPKKR